MTARRRSAIDHVALGAGFGAASWMMLCSAAGDVPSSGLGLLASPRPWLVVAFVAVLGATMVLTSPWEWRSLTRHLRASRRWAAHRCPECDHAMDPTVFDGPCPECGVPFARPTPPPVRRAGRLMAVGAGLAIAFAGCLAWQNADRAAFDREVAAAPSVRHARPRWWPAESSGFVYEPGSGVSAHE